MTKLKGKVKSISVKEVTEGIQVLWKNNIYSIYRIEDNGFVRLRQSEFRFPSHLIPISELKTLIVEYEDNNQCDGCRANLPLVDSIHKDHQLMGIGCTKHLYIKQLPLKYSQWQAAIDNGEVDSDKEVEFEIKVGYRNLGKYNGERFNEAEIQVAKIIPQKKRMYSEEEVKKYAWFAVVHASKLESGGQLVIKQSDINTYLDSEIA